MIFHILYNYILVIKLDWGIHGTGISYFLSQLTVTLIVIVFSYYEKSIKETNFIPSFAILTSDLKPYLKIASLSTAVMCFDWWAWEIMILISGLLTKEE